MKKKKNAGCDNMLKKVGIIDSQDQKINNFLG